MGIEKSKSQKDFVVKRNYEKKICHNIELWVGKEVIDYPNCKCNERQTI